MIISRYSHYIKIALILVIILLLSIATYFLLFNKGARVDNTTPVWQPYGQGKVFTKDLYKYVDHTLEESIEKSLHDLVREDTPTLYTATIRPGTYSEKTIPSGQVVKQMLVDVEPVELTYEVTVTSHKVGNDSVNILCAPQEEQMRNTAECKDFEGQ